MKMRMFLLSLSVFVFGEVNGASTTAPASSVTSHKLSIVTGGTGGVYYPLGGAIASVLKKHLPGTEATVEVTGGSVDNLNLVSTKKADVGFSMADAAFDAYAGKGKFDAKKPVRAIALFYPNNMQIVTLEGNKIEKLADLKGKRVSTGSPGSGTEIMSERLLTAVGIDPKKDIKFERLSISESVNALKDGKIDAFTWVGGVPTAAITDLAATPGIKMKLLDLSEGAAAMSKEHGSIYVAGTIPAKSYPNQGKDVPNIIVWNVLVVNEDADEKLIYDITKLLFEKKDELVAVHKDAEGLSMETQKQTPPIPFHKGSIKYFKEKGIAIKE